MVVTRGCPSDDGLGKEFPLRGFGQGSRANGRLSRDSTFSAVIYDTENLSKKLNVEEEHAQLSLAELSCKAARPCSVCAVVPKPLAPMIPSAGEKEMSESVPKRL